MHGLVSAPGSLEHSNKALRYFWSAAGIGFTLLSIFLAVGALLAILGYVAVQGVSSVNWAFVTELPRPVGVTGGGRRERYRR